MADRSDLRSFWQDAVEAYKLEVDHSPSGQTRFSEPTTPEDLLNLIKQQDKSFEDFRYQHSKSWSRMKRVLDPVITIGTLANSIVGSSQVGAPATVVLGSVLHLVTSCRHVTSAYDWMQTVFAELEEYAEALPSYVKTEMSDALQRKIVAILAFILRIFGRSETLIRRNRFRQYLRVSFIGKDEKTKALVDDLNKLLANQQRLVVALTYEKVNDVAEIGSETKNATDNINNKIDGIASDLTDIAATQVSQQQLENLEAVCKTSAVEDTDDWYSLLRKNLLQGSGAWLQKEAFFDHWMQHQASILWVFGGPGEGKSMLSAWLITLLLSKYESSNNTPPSARVAYFFVKESKESLRNINIMLKTFAWQLQQMDPNFRKHAASACEMSRNTARAEDTWENLFLNYFQDNNTHADARRAILIIDGLDEADAEARRRLLQLMKEYVARIGRAYPHRIQFAVFGRTTLRSDLKLLGFDSEEKVIEVSSTKNQDDMRNYIDYRLKKMSILQAMRSTKQAGGVTKAKKFARGIRRKVLEGADGVFLWAQLLLDQIEGKGEAQINRILSSPPQNLDDMIYSVFDRLSKDPEMDIEDSKKILAWITFAQRDLRFGEIDIILRLDSKTTNWLLWDHLRDKFSSILRFRYLRGNDPNAVGAVVHPEGSTSETNRQNPSDAQREANGSQPDGNLEQDEIDEDEDFNLGDDSEDDANSRISDDDDQSSRERRSEDVNYKKHSADTEQQQSAKSFGNDMREADTYYSWNIRQTKIDFAHHRFREYLKIEGDRNTRQRDALPINLDTHKVQVQLTFDCFKMLRLGIRNDYARDQYVSYPAFYLFGHLEKIEVDSIGPDEKVSLCSDLCWLLHEEDGCRALLGALKNRMGGESDMFWHLWLGNNRKTALLQDWLSMAANFDGLNPDQKAWASLASESVVELLKPLAMTAARNWLTKNDYEDRAYAAYYDKSVFQVWFLNGYRALDDAGKISEEIANFNESRDLNLSNLTAARIENLAEWAGLEKTTHWYTGVGWILYEAGKYERALEVLGEAVALDSRSWVAMEAIARAYGEDKGQYETAIRWMERALDVIPQCFKDDSTDAYLKQHIAGWKKMLGDMSAALDIAREAWSSNPSSMPCTDRYLRACIDLEQWKSVIYVLRYLDNWDTGNDVGGATFLVHYLTNYSLVPGLGRAIRDGGQPSFLLDALNQTIDNVSQTGNDYLLINRLLQFADLRYAFYDQDDEPIRLYEEAVTRISSADSSVQQAFAEQKMTYTNKLATMYFDLAVQEQMAGRDPSDQATKLKQLATTVGFTVDSEEDVFSYYVPGFPSLLWGRWLRDFERVETAVWRKCFRSRLLEQMTGLDDDDPTNDTKTCATLAISLFQAGDQKNAGAIIAVIFKTLEDYLSKQERLQAECDTDTQGTPKNTADVPSEIVDSPEDSSRLALHLETHAWYYSCNACGQNAGVKDEMWFCEMCYDTNFCGECLEGVKTRSLKQRFCNPDHCWYRAWPLDREKFKEMAEDMRVERGDGEIVLEMKKEWLQSLREEWMIQ